MKNEHLTRKEIYDNRLKQAGWNISDRTQVIEEFDIIVDPGLIQEASTPYSGHQYSDYVLLGKDGKPLAVVEAKKTSVDAAIGREQAKQYCYNILSNQGGELPFCFYTNGHDISFWDLENYPPKKVYGFPTRADLERYIYIRKARKSLTGELINTRIAGRDYQIRAIRAVMEAIEKRKRKFLLVMATGTGKTRICIALVDSLMRAGWAERVLFLVDRIALRDQTFEAFKEHLPNEPRWPKPSEKEIATDRRIYVSTYPSMLNVIRDENRPLSPHFFDLVIVDESHRSIYNTYQEILDYFNIITLGLTATPTDVIDHNTFQLFECEEGVPTFAYSYEEAINHIPPYLCNFLVMKIKTKFQDEGISKRTISLEDQQKLILEGKEIEEINYEGTEIEKKVINRGTNALIVREFMEESIKDSNGVLPGKTIFFCISKAHARRMEEIFDSLYPEYKGELAKVIVSEDPRVYGHLKQHVAGHYFAEFLNGVAFKPSEWQETGMKIIRIQNLTNPYNQYNRTKRKVDHKYIVNCGDVLVSWSATIGVFIWHDEPALLNQHIFKVNFDNSKVTKEYFILALKDTIRDLSKFAHGSTMKHVVKDDFDNHKIPLPSLNDQRYISNILTKAENLINQRKESICLLDEYLKSTFLEMFGSDLIREKKWKIIQFGEIITDLSDYHANGSYEILREHIVLKNELDYALIVRTTDLENKNFIEGCNYIDEAAYNFLKKSKIYGGEIIINKIGSAGNVYLMPNLNKPVSLGMNAFLLRFKEQANNIFIYYLLTSNFGEKAIQKHVKGAVTKTITKDAIRNIKIPFPPTELQNKFAQIVEKTETHKAQYQQSLQELEKLYGSLSQRAFKGELSFKDEKLMMAAEPDTFYPVNTHP